MSRPSAGRDIDANQLATPSLTQSRQENSYCATWRLRATQEAQWWGRIKVFPTRSRIRERCRIPRPEKFSCAAFFQKGFRLQSFLKKALPKTFP
ncbi:hypothetical protein ACU81Q_06920 [Komagataeibacter melomenusus]